MKSPRAPQKRLLLGTWLAVLSIMVNAALHGAWAQEMPVTDGFGGDFSICLAHGGSNGARPAEKGDPTGSPNDHCELCVIPAHTAVPASDTGSTAVKFQNSSHIIRGYEAPLAVSQAPGLQFDARGPPV